MENALADPGAAPSIGVILPTYNEAESICQVLREVCAVAGSLGTSFEVLVLDDASPDGTADLVERSFRDRPEVSVLRRNPPRGLALSIRQGIERTRASRIVVMDADLNHDPAHLPQLLAALADADLVSGCRFMPGGGMYSRTRQLGSHAMNLLIRGVLQTGMRDNLSGFFAVRRSALEALPIDRIFHGYGDFYFRLLAYARRDGLRLREIPVFYRPRVGGVSKTPLLRTALRYSWRLLRFAVTR